MITTVVFTADSKAGNLARIALAARRLGYQSVKQSKLDSNEKRYDKIQLELEALSPIYAEDLEAIKSMVPTVIGIRSSRRGPDSVARARQTQAPVMQRISAISAESSRDVKVLVTSYGKRIVEDFPKISHHVQRFDDGIDASVRDDAMLRLGKGIGRWQFKKNYALGAKLPLDKTLQRMLWPALAEFVDIVTQESRVLIKTCPHGAYSMETEEANCHFITGFLEGFLSEIKHFRAIEVVQTHKQDANGHCVFEVRPK